MNGYWIFFFGMMVGCCGGILLMGFIFGRRESQPLPKQPPLNETERWAKLQKEMEGE